MLLTIKNRERFWHKGCLPAEKVVISTGTIVLQDQLMTKDIPELSNYLIDEGYISEPLKSVIGKGKEHYL